ncbi:MAG: hypothetical protein QOK33_945, partial [Mycobacterium sp.]|nr:hypothetical protein [Mycobacterium sp.]
MVHDITPIVLRYTRRKSFTDPSATARFGRAEHGTTSVAIELDQPLVA